MPNLSLRIGGSLALKGGPPPPAPAGPRPAPGRPRPKAGPSRRANMRSGGTLARVPGQAPL